jgi:uncharacterized membrane protein YgdD (TMEM256/DUF423 family)
MAQPFTETEKKNPPRQLLAIGALGGIAIMLGAFGAHSLKGQMASGLITPDQVAGFDTGVKYQVYHTLAMLLVVLLRQHFSTRLLYYAYTLFYAGIIMFSGSLYLLCTRHLLGAEWLSMMGPVTPIGGLCFVAGWICLALSAGKKSKKMKY